MDYYLQKDYGFDFNYIGKLANNIVDATWMAIMGWNFYKIFVEKNKSIGVSPNRTKILKTLYSKNNKFEVV